MCVTLNRFDNIAGLKKKNIAGLKIIFIFWCRMFFFGKLFSAAYKILRKRSKIQIKKKNKIRNVVIQGHNQLVHGFVKKKKKTSSWSESGTRNGVNSDLMFEA